MPSNRPFHLVRTAVPQIPTDTHRKPLVSSGPSSQRGSSAPAHQDTETRVPFIQQAGLMLLACCAGVASHRAASPSVILRQVPCLSKLNTVGLVALFLFQNCHLLTRGDTFREAKCFFQHHDAFFSVPYPLQTTCC